MTATTTSAAGIQDAARHLAEARPAEAVTVLERLVADFPAYVTAHVLLAKAYEASGRAAEALDAWHHAYFLMPGSPLIVRERTRLLRIAPTAAPEAPAEPEVSAGSAPAEPEAVEPEAVEPEAPAVTSEPPDSDVDDEQESEDVLEEVPPEAETDIVAPEDERLASEADATESDAEPAPEEDEEPAAEENEEPLAEADDLDTLIHQLETAPRIRPDPDFRDEGLEEEDEEEDGLVSETLARIYAAQKQYAAAARAYEQLAEQHPDRAAEFEAKAAEMRDLAGETEN